LMTTEPTRPQEWNSEQEQEQYDEAVTLWKQGNKRKALEKAAPWPGLGAWIETSPPPPKVEAPPIVPKAAPPLLPRRKLKEVEPQAEPEAKEEGDALQAAGLSKKALDAALAAYKTKARAEEPEEEEEGEEEEAATPGEEERPKAGAFRPSGEERIPRAAFSRDAPIEDPEPAVLSPAASYDNAREFARRRCWKAGSLAVYAWGDGFWEWNGRAYQLLPEAEFKAAVYRFLDESAKISEGARARFRPKPRQVSELLDGLKAGLLLPGWCEPPMRLDTGERIGEVLAFSDGLMDVRTEEWVEPSPKLWVHNSVQYDWNPEAQCPEWLRFLESIFPSDQEAKDCLEEFLGLSMTEDISFQKGLMLIGVPRSGKGTLITVGQWLTGSDAFVSLDLDKWNLGENSGEVLIGKKLLAFPDVRLKEGRWYGQNWDAGGVDFMSVQRLLKITGGDGMSLGRKWKSSWTGVLPGKVWLASNKVPNFNDAVLPTRFNKLAFEVSYLNREDLWLPHRLRAELSGIAARCIAAYRRARKRGRLIQPRSSERLGHEIAVSSDPFIQFVTETFVSDPEGTVVYAVAMDRLRSWCEEHGRKELLESVKNNKIRGRLRAVPGFEDVIEAPRPHGQPRRMARIRLRRLADEPMEGEG
jgi:putative DNA primase/helicase